jgi:molybdopterin/thiamine biosynthesis adenylyltransferase
MARYEGFFRWEENKPKVMVVGLGSIGSYVALGLQKSEYKLVLVDFDVVEKANLNVQLYGNHQIGDTKASALRNILYDVFNSKNEIEIHEAKFEDCYERISKVPFIFLCVDSIDARKKITNIIRKEFNPTVFIDCRSGGGYYELYTIINNNEDQWKEYKESLKGDFLDLECGFHELPFGSSYLASLTLRKIVRFLNGYDVKFHNYYDFIGGFSQ